VPSVSEEPSTLDEALALLAHKDAVIAAAFAVLNAHPELTGEVVSALAARSPDAAALDRSAHG